MAEMVVIDGDSLTSCDLMRLSQPGQQMEIAETAWTAVRESRKVVDLMLEKRQVAYGINTGFGLFSNVVIDDDELELLQRNLIRSHSAGVGEPLSYERTRMLLTLRINVLCRGNSGVSEGTLRQMVDAFNKGCMSVVPAVGSVGASGDLAPLSHLALGLMGEGLMWDHSSGDASKSWAQRPAADVLRENGLQPIQLKPKEGLALINGTQLITALGCEATHRARNVQRCADVVAALTIEVLKGTVNAFHPRIHERRPHRGQGIVAARLRALLHPGEASELFHSHEYKGRVQDAYSLRCTPQVHGVVADTVDFVQGIIETEANSSGDNPMVFAESSEVTKEVDGVTVHVWPPKAIQAAPAAEGAKEEVQQAQVETLDQAKAEIARLQEQLNAKNQATGFKRPSDTFYDSSAGFIVSGGNFHGEYPAKALDYLAIAVSEIASISERRIERLVNPTLSNLPAFLVENGGLNSGFMIAHCTAAALVSENKVLSHPSSVDSISTSAAKEDHVSMGGMSARKAVQIVENVERVVAIELLAACQALEFHRPLRTTPALEALASLVREKVQPWDKDRIMYLDIDSATHIVKSGELWDKVAPFLQDYADTFVR